MRDCTPRLYAARLTYNLLLRTLCRLGGQNSGQIGVMLGIPTAMARDMMLNLVEYPELPCYLDAEGLLCCRIEPYNLPAGPCQREYSERQTGSLVAHYIACQCGLDGRPAISHVEVAALCNVKAQTASVILMSLSGVGGIPIYADRRLKGWSMLDHHIKAAWRH